MPEYLAPGVYVEEIPSANKPIQAASTSTAGMVGMTVRGPVGRPELVTSLGAYARLFGGRLNPAEYPPGLGLLPFAVEGFFANGGSRLYVVRVVGGNATHSSADCQVADAAGRTVLRAPAGTGSTQLVVTSAADFTAGDTVLVGGGTPELAVIGLPDAGTRHVLHAPLRRAYAAGSTATVQQSAKLDPVLAAAALAGQDQLALDDTTGLSAGMDLLLTSPGAEPATELAQVTAVDTEEHLLTLAWPLSRSFPPASTLWGLNDSADADAQSSLVSRALAGMDPGVLELDEAANAAAGDILRLADAGGGEMARVDTISTAMSVQDALRYTHETGAEVQTLASAFTVHARWPGSWGDALRVSLRPAVLASTVLSEDLEAGQQVLRVPNALGLHPGSVLVFSTPPGAPGALPSPEAELEVLVAAAVDRATGSVTLLSPPAMLHPAGTAVTSREFTLQVDRTQDGKAVETETFANLSLNPNHPNFAPGIVGAWQAGGPLEAGQSELIRLQMAAGDPPTAAPVGGIFRYLANGADDAAGVTVQEYIGNAAVDPGERTGIQALENEPTLSLVAVPGLTDLGVQQALVAHCEKMRYRFAVLDAPSGAKLNAARAHRQNFDSTRAAIYYPQVRITDPFGTQGRMLSVPASGHVLGVYARTDATRGVHKAPANEVIVGAQGLEATLAKGEQDILNPINLNVLRDFRSENRGIRVYGARVATSDPEWKYVNVRRLLLFIEQSLDNGLQWAVFEPNDTPLWDAVKQSVTGFLDTVWRSGALEGAKASEAFFVNIGYNVTMSQADIDNGLLVVEIGVAPVKPAEFVVVRISQKTREAVS